jgi:hypothetical protein
LPMGLLFRVCPTFYTWSFSLGCTAYDANMMREPHAVTLTPPSEAACRLSWGWRSSLFLTGM